MKKKDKITLIVIAGAAIAATLAYLLSSEKGTEIRKKAVQKGKKIIEDAEKLISELKCKEEKQEAVS